MEFMRQTAIRNHAVPAPYISEFKSIITCGKWEALCVWVYISLWNICSVFNTGYNSNVIGKATSRNFTYIFSPISLGAEELSKDNEVSIERWWLYSSRKNFVWNFRACSFSLRGKIIIGHTYWILILKLYYVMSVIIFGVKSRKSEKYIFYWR